ncbi:MAG: PD40 domain-containing protein [Anaerolineales bacterium]|nr:PD40 domain-containing protein [Anaerolineales bacterium]
MIFAKKNILLLSLGILFVSSCKIHNTQSLSSTSHPTSISSTSVSPLAATREFTPSENVNGRFVVSDLKEVYFVDPIRNTISRIETFQEPLVLIAFSPDGNKLAYLLNNSLTIVDTNTNGTNELVENQIGSIGGRMAWSPDGSMIALTCATPSHPTSEICLVNTVDGSIRAVTNSKELGILNPYDFVGFESWNNEGSAAAFTLNRTPSYGGDEKNDVYILDLITRKTRLVFNSQTQSNILNVGWVSVAPDNKALLFHGKVNGNFQIFQINMDGSGLRQITDQDGYDVTNPVWNPNGTLFSALLYNSKGNLPSQVIIFDLNGEVVQRLKVNVSGFVVQWLK